MGHFAGTTVFFEEGKQKEINSHFLMWIIFFITILSSVIRIYHLGDHSLWYDEAASVNSVRSILEYPQDDPWGPFSFTKRERVPPLYFFLLVPFYLLANNEWCLRLLSVIFGVGSIPLTYLLGRQLANQQVGIIATLLLAFSPFHLYYSQELRPYSMFLFFALCTYVLFNQALRDGKLIYFIGLIATVVLGFYTHTYMLFVLALIDIIFVLQWNKSRPFLYKWLLCHLVIAILCIPELYILSYHILRGNTTLFNYKPGLRSIAGTLYLFTAGRFFFPTFPNILFITAQGSIWGFGLAAGLWSLWKARRFNLGYQALIFISASFIMYFLIFFISISIFPLFDEARINYLIFLLPAYTLIVALGLSIISNKYLKIVIVSTTLCISLVCNYPYFFQWDTIGKGDFRAVADYIEPFISEEDIVYHTTNNSTYPLEYYLNWQVPQVLIDPFHNPANGDSSKFWLVVFKPSGAVKYVQDTLGQQSALLPSRPYADSNCSSVLPDLNNVILIRSKDFPGKNEMSVCQYLRVTP